MNEKPKTIAEQWGELAAAINTGITTLAGLIGVVFLVLLLIFGFRWFAETIYIPASLITTGIYILTFCVAVPLAFFKKTRGVAGILFIVSATFIFFTVWIWGLILAKLYAGAFWTVVGLFFAGIGIIPIAMIATLLHGEWLMVGQFVLFLAIIMILRFFGFFLFTKIHINQDLQKVSEPNSELDNEIIGYLEDYRSDNEKLARIGEFFEFDKPLIPDIELLPFPKAEIRKILVEKEQELCDLANACVEKGEKEKLPELENYIGALGATRGFVQVYTEIEGADRADVDYFNSYSDQSDIPEDELSDFMKLYGKYLSKGMKNVDKD